MREDNAKVSIMFCGVCLNRHSKNAGNLHGEPCFDLSHNEGTGILTIQG